MKIPETLKVGGICYKVEVTDNLATGRDNSAGEIDFNKSIIRIQTLSHCRMQATFVHEVIHALYDHMGIVEHNEEEIDRFAKALYMLIEDNPEMFKQD